MLKYGVLAVCLVVLGAAAPKNTADLIVGEWTFVALSPPVEFQQCFNLKFSKHPGNTKCTSADDKLPELFDIVITNEEVPASNFAIPLLFVDDLSEVTPYINVTGKCGDEPYPNRSIVRSVNSNYFGIYRPQINDKEPNSLFVYSKVVPSRAQLTEDLKTIEEFKGRSFGVMCTSELAEEHNALPKPTRVKNVQSALNYFESF